MKEKKLVVYVGPYSFPNGGAAARRIYGNALSIRNAGFNVEIASGQCQDEAPTGNQYKGFPVVTLNERTHEKLPSFLKSLAYLNIGKETINWLDSLKKKPIAIILYSGYSPYLLRLLKWSKKNNVKLIFDTVEWYDPPSLLAKLFSPYYLNIELAMRYFLLKTTSLFVISTYIDNYYRSKNCKTLLIPPTVDTASITPRLTSNLDDSLILTFAGTVGRKELISNIILSVVELNHEGVSVRLNIAGATFNDIRGLKDLNRVPDHILNKYITCHGVVSHDSAVALVKMADYSVIIRPISRSVQAGFSTKFVESFALGTPVICNITSDLGMYIKHEQNGLVCKGLEVENIKGAIIQAVTISNDAYLNMRKSARETAEKYFDINNYSNSIKNLLED